MLCQVGAAIQSCAKMVQLYKAVLQPCMHPDIMQSAVPACAAIAQFVSAAAMCLSAVPV